MAAGEARAVWQRTANRYFIQDDAIKAPKLACCSSISSLISNVETKPVNSASVDDSYPFPDGKSFDSNLESDSKWWIQLQPDYMHQRGLSSEQFNPLDLESRNLQQFIQNQYGNVTSINSLSSKRSYEFVEMDYVELPWWQMAEKDDFCSFDSNRSHVLIENSDHNWPVHTGLESQKFKYGQNAISCGRPHHDASKTKILEALCHSQTRARKAEFAAKKACTEKEHAIKLVFRQASQLFAYRQWIYVLQLEKLCYQIRNKKGDQMLSVTPVSPSKIGNLNKNLKKVASAKGKRARTKHGFGRHEHDLSKYAVIFMVGLGIVGAGLVLGWTVGWMLI
ncbi:hypothetical protein R6Q59_006354 [Mikania micrantha]|uniref:Uncharacterized protein n=1 Tax=Mikania micrantha TaxID=192012 RepID=A0A5N6PTX0_9ASTR|nr:hypothetical protein E3N88_04267 [Mikania micrantha]